MLWFVNFFLYFYYNFLFSGMVRFEKFYYSVLCFVVFCCVLLCCGGLLSVFIGVLCGLFIEEVWVFCLLMLWRGLDGVW